MKRHLAWIIPVVLIVALGFTAKSYFKAIGIADAAAAESTRLIREGALLAQDTVRMSRDLESLDATHALQRRADSIRIAALDEQNVRLTANFDSLVVADRSNAEDVEAALSALEAELDPRHLPALRLVTRAYDTRILGLSSQVSVALERIDVVTEQRDVARGDADREREGRLASDALRAGLSAVIVQKDAVIASKDVEIGSLRNAVAPGFFTRLAQNAKLVAITSAISAGLTFAATR